MIVTVRYTDSGIYHYRTGPYAPSGLPLVPCVIHHIVADDQSSFIEQLWETIDGIDGTITSYFNHCIVIYQDEVDIQEYTRHTIVTQRFNTVEEVIMLYDGDYVSIEYSKNNKRVVEKSDMSRNSPINASVVRAKNLMVGNQELNKQIDLLHKYLTNGEYYDFATTSGFYAMSEYQAIPIPWLSDYETNLSRSTYNYSINGGVKLRDKSVVTIDGSKSRETIDRMVERYDLDFPFQWLEGKDGRYVAVNFESSLSEYWHGYERYRMIVPGEGEELNVHIKGPVSEFYRKLQRYHAQQQPALQINYITKPRVLTFQWPDKSYTLEAEPPSFPNPEYQQLWYEDHRERLALNQDESYCPPTVVNPVIEQIRMNDMIYDRPEYIEGIDRSLEHDDWTLLHMLKEGLVIAGSYALKYAGYPCMVSDIDVFVYQSECSFESQLDYILEWLDAYVDQDINIIQETSQSISIKAGGYLIQVIKRVYQTPQQIIYGFDLPMSSWMVRWDDGDFVVETTPLGLWSTSRSLIVFDVNNASTSYYSRLSKYRYSKGANIWLPGLRQSDIELANSFKELFKPFVALSKLDFEYNNRAISYLRITTFRRPASDYFSYSNKSISLDQNNQVVAVSSLNDDDFAAVMTDLEAKYKILPPSHSFIDKKAHSQGWYNRYTNSFHPVKMSWQEYYYDGTNRIQLPRRVYWMTNELNRILDINGFTEFQFVYRLPTLRQVATRQVSTLV